MRCPRQQYVREVVTIHAPLERCWALSTRVELVQKTLGMKLAGGVTTGHIVADSRVVWRGWKFGLPTSHHTLITAFSPPHTGCIGDEAAQFDRQHVAWFEDTQERGRFASFRHMHLLREVPEGTELEDHVRFALPFGALGRLLARSLLAPHIRKLARQRFALIKDVAETEGWREWVDQRTGQSPIS